MKMKGLWVGMIILTASLCLTAPAFGQSSGTEQELEETVGIVDDITEEVLTGPNDMNPEKILGPGGVALSTEGDLLMSFGATVRFIPTAESDWDFGLEDEVPGYFNTQPLSGFLGASLDTATSVNQVYLQSLALNTAITESNAATIAAFNDFANSLYTADELTTIPQVSRFAGGVASIQDLGNTVGNNAQAAFFSGVAAGGAAGGVAALNGAATQAEQRAAAAAAAAAANPGNPALQQQAAGAAGAAAGLRAAANAVVADPDAAANVNTIANATTIEAMVQGAGLVQNAEDLAAGVAQQIDRNPSAGAGDLGASIAGLSAQKAMVDGFDAFFLADTFLKTHSNESGSVNDSYIRNETKMYFNAMPRDKKWSFYGALEFDRPIDTETVDNRGGRTDGSSNFGLERLNASIELVENLRLHAGWDVWGLDIIEAGSMVYGDDNPGFWIRGDYNPYDFSIAWLKLEENDFQIEATDHNEAADEDRDLIAGYFDYFIPNTLNDKIRVFAAWDRIRNAPSLDLTGAIANGAGLADFAGIYGNNGIIGTEASAPETDAYTIGGYYLGTFNIFELMVEGAYKFGSADNTGLQGVDNGVDIIQYNDFDISSYAFAADLGVELKDLVGWHSLKPHVGYMYTSGDDDPNDDKLEGFSGITNAQRFSRFWGGENTIIGDSNFVLGTALYGYVPEYYGNGTPVFVGGLQNAVGTGNGRGDNPGTQMISVGITMRPMIYLIYRTNVNMFWWNEDFYVANMVDPITITAAGLQKTPYTKVDAGYVGTEWNNEITLALSKNMFVKGQAALYFPGDGIEEVTAALSGGEETDEIATRLAMELIWNF